MRLIEKEMTDRFYDILEKHGDKTSIHITNDKSLRDKIN